MSFQSQFSVKFTASTMTLFKTHINFLRLIYDESAYAKYFHWHMRGYERLTRYATMAVIGHLYAGLLMRD